MVKTTKAAGCKDTDIRVENHGSIFLLIPESPIGRDWLKDAVAKDALWFRGLVVEPRYVEDIVIGAREDGLEVR